MAAPVVAFLLSALLPLSCSQWSDQLAWLYNRQGTDHASALADAAASTCPDVCDCPPTFPVAMYCDGRGLAAVPSVPSHIKYLYLQNNAITAVPDSALANATSLVWLMLHHNQLTSEAIGAKVNKPDKKSGKKRKPVLSIFLSEQFDVSLCKVVMVQLSCYYVSVCEQLNKY